MKRSSRSIDVVMAFAKGIPCRAANVATDGTNFTLFGHVIAGRTNQGFMFTLAGYDTNTTRKYLNVIFGELDLPLRLCRKSHEPYVYNHKTDTYYPIRTRVFYKPSDFFTPVEMFTLRSAVA